MLSNLERASNISENDFVRLNIGENIWEIVKYDPNSLKTITSLLFSYCRDRTLVFNNSPAIIIKGCSLQPFLSPFGWGCKFVLTNNLVVKHYYNCRSSKGAIERGRQTLNTDSQNGLIELGEFYCFQQRTISSLIERAEKILNAHFGSKKSRKRPYYLLAALIFGFAEETKVFKDEDRSSKYVVNLHCYYIYNYLGINKSYQTRILNLFKSLNLIEYERFKDLYLMKIKI